LFVSRDDLLQLQFAKMKKLGNKKVENGKWKKKIEINKMFY